MSKIISIHAFRGGTGKSSITANLAALLAAEGRRVGIVDTHIQTAGKHSVAPQLKVDGPGEVIAISYDQLFPSSVHVDEISRVLREGYDVHLLNDGIHALIQKLALDILLIDTQPGLNEETLMSIAVSDTLIMMMRPDQQDYQGTGVAIEVARELDIPHLMLIVNQVPTVYNMIDVNAHVEETYNCEVAAVLPFAHEMLSFADAGVFVQHYPDHPITRSLRRVADRLLKDPSA